MEDATLSENDEYIKEAIRKAVWGGYASDEELGWIIDDLVEDGDNEVYLRSYIQQALSSKKQEEKNWPSPTHYDLLKKAFKTLDKRRILCVENAGYTMSDGHQEAFEILSDNKGRYDGYCFFHGQDLERAVDGGGLMLAFDHVKGDVPEKLDVGIAVQEEISKVGLEVEWDRTVDSRINLPKIKWQKHSN